MDNHDYVLVQLNDNNLGDHAIVGFKTKIQYGYRSHGDRFLMHVDDVPLHVNPRVNSMRVVVVVQEPVITDDGLVFDEPEVAKEEPVAPKPDETKVGDIPAIGSLESLSDRQVAMLEAMGIANIKELYNLGLDGLIAIKGIGPVTAQKVLAEASKAIDGPTETSR